MKVIYGPPITVVEAQESELPPLYCLSCGYDLRGLPSNRCSECGAEFHFDRWHATVRKTLQDLQDAAHMVSWVNAAWRRAGMTMVCRVAALAADWSDLALIVLGGVGCGCALFAIAGAVYGWRMSRLPAWARARLSPQPNAASVWTAIALLLVTGVSIVVF